MKTMGYGEKAMNENLNYNNALYKAFRTQYKKTLIQFAILFVTSLLIGAFLPSFLSESFLISIFQNVILHFEIPIYQYNIDHITVLLNAIFKYSLSDIICIFCVFIFSFSSYHYMISGIVLIYSGIKNGCVASLIYFLPRFMTENAPKVSEICVFYIAKTIIVLVVIRYVIRAYAFSIKFFNENSYSLNRFPTTLKFVCSSLLYIFALLFLHSIYVFLIKTI